MQVRFTDSNVWKTIAITAMVAGLVSYLLSLIIEFVITYWFVVVLVLGGIGFLLYYYSQRE